MLSVVVPMYNEEEVLPQTLSRLRNVLDHLDENYEVICVDDGSVDRTADLLRDWRTHWSHVRMIRLRTNAGHQNALTAGLDAARGDYVVTIDADLQDPPELIPTMLEVARGQGADVVYAVRDDRTSDTRFKRLSAGVYYWVMRRLTGRRVPAHAGDFRLISRAVVTALNSLPERHRVYRLLIPWLGFPSASVTYVRDPRAAGQTKYPLSRMIRLSVDSVTSFTSAPLRVATWLGSVGFVVCMLLGGLALIAYFAGVTVPGWASLSVVLLFLGAVQLLSLGLLGEYVGRLYAEQQGRPLYFVAEDTAFEVSARDPRR